MKRRDIDMRRNFSTRQFAIAAGATLVAGLATAGPAQAQPASPSASVRGGALTIVGTDGDDAIAVQLAAADPNTLRVDLGNGTLPQAFDRSTFTAITVFLRSGDDQFQVVPGGGTLADEALSVDGDVGRDTITGGDGNDNLAGGAGADSIQGGDGTDLIFGNRGNDAVNGNRGNDPEFLGRGRDDALWNPGEGSDVIHGGAASDTLIFNGADVDEIMSLSANEGRAVLLRDIGGVRMDTDSIENLDLAALGGADTVTVDNLDGTAVRSADIDLSSQGAGDRQVDSIIVNGTNQSDRIKVDADNGAVEVDGLPAETHITGSEPTDQLTVNSLGGNDKADVSNAAKALIGVEVNLGTGQR
jgi:hypothetical protein